MRNKRKNGFTLVELTVVLVIFAIIMAIASPFFVRYWRAAEFRKNESNARTVYLAAESKLTWYRNSGQWNQFKKEIEKNGIKGGFQDNAQLNDRIYAITLDSDTYGTDQASGNPVLELLDDATYDKGNLNAAIAIEIDIESGEVYSAFYGTKCKGLDYADADNGGYLTMNKRDYESRRQRLLGYYSTEDTVNVVELDPVRLRIMTISLLNNEKLSLNWSSNVGNSQAVSYVINFYKKDDDTKLFGLTMSPYDMWTKGWNGKSGEAGELASLTLTDSTGTEKGSWDFPVTYNDNKYSLVLDAMMSAKTMAALNAVQDADARTELEKTSSTSICRLSTVAEALSSPQNIYATVQAVSYAGTERPTLDDFMKEYRDSESVSSNTANSMYGDNTSGTNVEINTFRHLSNIRYYGENKSGTFTLKAKNMDWTSAGTGLYDADNQSQTENQQRSPLRWQDSSSQELDFPSVPVLGSTQTLTGSGNKTLITNLRLGGTSVISDQVVDTIKKDMPKPQYLGLFSEILGNVSDVTLKDPTLQLTASATAGYSSLKGVGILAGRYGGKQSAASSMENVTVTVSNTAADAPKTVDVDLTQAFTVVSEVTRPVTPAVGGVIGVAAGVNETGGERMLNGSVKNVTMEGSVQVVYAATMDRTMPEEPTNGSSNKSKIGEIGSTGGIIGYAWLSNQSNNSGAQGKIESCVNHAAVTSNYMAGGIAGFVDGEFNYAASVLDETSYYSRVADLLNCSNDGLVLSSADAVKSTLEGHYVGGIVGYARKAVIYGAASASGRAAGFTYSENNKDLLKGDYVGGIVGYGDKSVINSCSTEKRGYVLGADYVGGIAGGLGKDVKEAIRADGNVSVTTNGNYVIGKNYVGGITGINQDGVTLKNCVNNGVAASYEKYAGGIVGYNEKASTILDCASYLSDYDNSVFNMIVNTWNAKGDYAGGIAGYNDGDIVFTASSEAITVKSVSSIIVGNNYVGGIAGFNDVDGTLDVHYTLIGGRIYGYEDAVGGCFGLNASENVLSKELVIKPRSVEGRYYVGGVIGANVVNLSKNITMDQYRSENSLGSITGTAFVGGLIGYQRTYTSSELGTTDGVIRETLEANLKAGGRDRLLPTLNNSLVPATTAKSTNKYTLTITTKNNKDLDTAANNVPIQASLYAGGIVGYCEKDSDLVIKDCWNKGGLTLNSGSTQDVTLADFIRSQEVGRNNLPSDTEKIDLHFVGGIIGVNLENQVIDHCANTGSMSGFAGIGGIVGLNAGLIYDCSLNDNFGNAGLSYLGGIASVNVQSSDKTNRTYENVKYTTGTIQNCSTAKNKTVSGNNVLGGIAAWNLLDGTLKQNSSLANITGAGNYVGGVAGRNGGIVEIKDESDDSVTRTIRSSKGSGIGGVVGLNEADGTLLIDGTANDNGELTAVGTGVTVIGYEKVGGIVGINRGTLGEDGSASGLASQAKLVRATHGYAGGVVGTTAGNLYHAVNRSAQVTADAGTAGGITALNESGKTISSCVNYGNVSSSNGHAGGIVAENEGTVIDCTVEETGTGLTIYSRGVDETGAVCAVNTGTIRGSKPVSGVQLQGSASIFGGIVGTNKNVGTVDTTTLTYMPEISSTSGGSLTVGGAVGQNDGTVQNVETTGIAFEKFTNYKYLGGIAGTNGLNATGENGAKISGCTFSGTITETRGAAGNCYGGIAGINYATLENCNVGLIDMEIQGVYTATSTSTTEQKEALASHAGGITGKNETDGLITGCTLDNNKDSLFRAQYGMLGGVTGFNKGKIEQSGSSITPQVLTSAVMNEKKASERLKQMHKNATDAGLKKESTYLKWQASTALENVEYNGTSRKVSADRLNFYMDTNGNLGGITAFNAVTGELTGCVSGDWFLSNKSETLGVGTGGIIGMNESENDLRFLVNGAFVGRQLTNEVSDRFAGGIIGNQNNTTTSDWVISDCINYGTVYCYNTHYSGGIMGQWTGTGGTIENCRNYGNLQTTYYAGWIGASGGIVAQLYHANENNEYNIIGCGNYGDIYKRSGPEGNGANDSAGILGNITTYKVSSVKNATKFTVQILDCVNAPTTSIYSGSMASGIFGFLSSENIDAWGNGIDTSTNNVTIRIERCMNFASSLQGSNYYAGIFGDRYGKPAWTDNTIIKDSFSVNQGNSSVDYAGGRADRTPIVGRGKNQDTEGPHLIADPENRRNNYYLEGDWNANPNFYNKTKISIGEGTPNGSGTITATQDESGLTNKYCRYLFFMLDTTKNVYIAANINPGQTVDGAVDYIDEYGHIVDADGNRKGELLFYCDANAGTYTQDGVYNIVCRTADNIVFTNARTAYRRLEGIVTSADGTEKILAPEKVHAYIQNGRIHVTVTPQELPGGTDGELCDPFMYIVTVSDKNGNSIERKLYTEDGSFAVPSGLSGELTVSVKAVSMFDDVEESEAKEADSTILNPLLPNPEVRIQLVSSSTGYEYSLDNLDAYSDYPDWQVEISVQGVGTVTLDESHPTDTLNVTEKDSNKATYQMVAKATIKAGSSTKAEDSDEVSTSVNLPCHAPSYMINSNSWETMNKSVTVSGTTLDDMSIQVEIDASSRESVTTPPIYRAELIGTWTDTSGTRIQNAVLAKTDILTVSQGKATATFSNLPEYIGEATDMKVRIWYAASGLGSVYTYGRDQESADATVNGRTMNVRELVYVTEEDGQRVETWNYTDSSILSDLEFNKYRWYTDTLFTWLDKPELVDADTDKLMSPDADGNYTFKWDQDPEATPNARYEVSLTGIDAEGREVTIPTDEYYKDNRAKQLVIDGSDWNYLSVKLKVTRIGDTSGTDKTIGLSATGTYLVKARLETPGAPSVSITDENELNYELTWSPISSETGCVGYQPYIRVYNGDTLGDAQKLGNLVTTDQIQAGMYRVTRDLEDYAGQKVVLYLVAKADEKGSYLDSLDGVTYELTVPDRLTEPKVTWNNNWTYNRDNALAADAFRDGGMQVGLTAQDNASIPQGDSAYLLRAYIYDSEDAADSATVSNPGNYTAVYPLTYGSGVPAQMEMKDARNYYHNLTDMSLKYAGKWILFYARISSGSGNVSSRWTSTGQKYRLPYVKLDMPEVNSDTKDTKVTADIADAPELPSHQEEWAAERTVLTWNSVDSADYKAGSTNAGTEGRD